MRGLQRLGLVAALAAQPLAAEGVALLQITAGSDRIDVMPDQIATVRIVDAASLPAVRVTLVPALDTALRTLTAAHLGEALTFRLCGEVVMQPVVRDALTRADFMLAVVNAHEARRVAGVLNARSCQR